MVKNVLRTFAILLLGAVLAACSSGFEGSELDTQAFELGSYRRVTLNKLFSPPGPNDPKYNCVTTEFSLPPQGYRANGSTGGMTHTSFAAFAQAGDIGTGFKSNFFSSFATNPQNTEILIVDDFGKWSSPSYKVDNEIFASNATSTTIQNRINEQKLTHGALVMRHANDAVLGSGLYSQSEQTTDGRKTTYARGTSKLQVTGINTRLQNQAVISGKVKVTTGDVATILDFLKNAPSKVVNMSFVLIPCEVFEDFAQSGLATLELYVEALAKENKLSTNQNGVIDASGSTSAGERTLIQAIINSTDIDNDPLKVLIRDTANKHVYVGASGNYGVDYSMYPALWPGVVNVTGSAVQAEDVRANSFFNQGEVMTVGSLFQLKPPTTSGKSVYYFGTSYAAPSVSVFSALDLAGKQRCTDSQTFKSELALDSPSLTDRRLEGTTGAVQTRCLSN